MKKLTIFAFATFMTLSSVQANSTVAKGAGKVVDEIVEVFSKLTGRHIDDTARLAMKKQLRQAALKHGEEALTVARNGGVDLLQAAVKHGDDIWKYARQYPQGAQRLAMNADELLPLCRQYGDDILRIEAKAASAAPKVVQQFGDDGVRYFAKNVPAKDMPRLTGLARHADSPATKELLLKKYGDEGVELFNRLDKKTIMAVGLTSTMLLGTYQITDSVGNAIETVAETAPERLGTTINETFSFATTPISITLGVIGIIISAWLFFKLNIIALIKKNRNNAHNHNIP